MKNINSTKNKPNEEGSEQNHISFKFKKPKPLIIVIGFAIILVLVLAFFAKGLFVAATVNGSPISRLSVIQELEEQGGAQALEALIDQKLIETELDKQGISVTQEEIDKEIQEIEDQVASQGGALEDALVAQGMTKEELKEQIVVQKRLEKLLADKTVVSDDEVNSYITDNNITLPEDTTTEEFEELVRSQLEQQKFQQEAQRWVADLTTNAEIKYYVEY